MVPSSPILSPFTLLYHSSVNVFLSAQAVRTTSHSCCSAWGRGRQMASRRSRKRGVLTSWRSRRRARAACTTSLTRHPSVRDQGAQRLSSSWTETTPGYAILIAVRVCWCLFVKVTKHAIDEMINITDVTLYGFFYSCFVIQKASKHVRSKNYWEPLWQMFHVGMYWWSYWIDIFKRQVLSISSLKRIVSGPN